MATKLEATITKKFESAQDSLVLQSSDLSLETIAQMVAAKHPIACKSCECWRLTAVFRLKAWQKWASMS